MRSTLLRSFLLLPLVLPSLTRPPLSLYLFVSHSLRRRQYRPLSARFNERITIILGFTFAFPSYADLTVVEQCERIIARIKTRIMGQRKWNTAAGEYAFVHGRDIGILRFSE